MLDSLGEMEGARHRRAAAEPSISPTYFTRQVKDVASATLNFGTSIQLPKPKRASAKVGLRFEKTVLDSFTKRFTDRLATGVPISFQEIPKGAFYPKPQTAIPDALLLSADKRSLCIIEIKLRHSTDAWFQLNRFYLPLLRSALGSSMVLRTVEICRYYDPGVKLPKGKTLIVDIENVFRLSGDEHPVLIWEKL